MKKSVQGWIVRFLILAVLVGAAVAVHLQVSKWRVAVTMKQEQLRQAPVQDLAAASLRADLRRKQEDVSQVLTFVPTRDDMVGVVTSVEEEGKRRGLETAVVDIKEQAKVDGAEGEADNSLQHVELHVVASGDPSGLMEFLYAVEHLPYMLYGNNWRLSVSGTQIATRGTGGIAQVEESIPAVAPDVSGKLTLTLILAVRNQEVAL